MSANKKQNRAFYTRGNTLVILFGCIIVSLLASPVAAVTTTQWLPEQGTVVEYEVWFHGVTIQGEYLETNEFRVYNASLIEVHPSILNTVPIFNSSTKIGNNSRLIFRHVYHSKTESEWKKVRTLIVDGVEYSLNSSSVGLFIRNNSYFSLTNNIETVPKLDFTMSVTIPDFINNSVGLGDIALTSYSNNFKTISITSSEITAMYNLTILSTFNEFLIIAGKDGKVKEYTLAVHSPLYYDSGFHSFFYTFKAVKPSFLFGLSIDMLLYAGGGLVVGLIIGLIVAVAVRKRG